MAKWRDFELEIIPNMYELGLFKRTMQSRQRLRITAAIALTVLCLLYFGVGRLIHYVALSLSLSYLCIVGLYFCVLIVSYLVALVVGDIMFAGPWLKKMRLGRKFLPDDIEEQKALVKNRNGYFICVWAASFAILVLGCDFVTGSHVHWFHTYGGILYSMNSDSADERKLVLKTISNPYYGEKWQNEEIREKLEELVLDSDNDVRGYAAYICGKAKISEASANLIALLNDHTMPDDVRAEAAIALGRLEWKPARSQLLTVLRERFKQNRSDNVLTPSILYAFFTMKDPIAAPDAMNILQTCLVESCSESVLQYAFFYLKSLRIKQAASTAFDYLSSEHASVSSQCYAADILRFTASPNDVPKMKSAFDHTAQSQECPVVYRKFHGEAAVILFEQDTMRALFVRAIGNLKRPEDYDWIWMVGSNTAENLQTRKVAEMYARANQAKK